MALFRRNKSGDAPALPEEVNSYYQAEKRDRTWMAWLLALLSLAVAALIIMALFFGGRWLYRKLRPQTKPAEPETTQTAEQSPVASNNSSGNSSGNQDANKDKEKEKSQGTVTAPANPNSSTSSPTAPATTSQPGATNTNLPSTGPGDVVAVFVLTSLGGTLLHRYVLRPKNNV